jgi:hypothetical protein
MGILGMPVEVAKGAISREVLDKEVGTRSLADTTVVMVVRADMAASLRSGALEARLVMVDRQVVETREATRSTMTKEKEKGKEKAMGAGGVLVDPQAQAHREDLVLAVALFGMLTGSDHTLPVNPE